MITQEMIDRINELSRKKKTVGLTEAELSEQKELYRVYLDAIRANVRAQLECVEIVDGENENVKKS